MKMALMIIDLQNAYRDKSNEDSMNSACEYINATIPLFRKRNLPVIWVQHKDAEDGSIPGERGFEFIDCLKPEPGDYRITKEYGNSFNKTGCADILAKEGIDTVVLTGYCAEHCVLSTYRGALDLDLTPVLLKKAVASGEKAHIGFVENISAVISYQILQKILD